MKPSNRFCDCLGNWSPGGYDQEAKRDSKFGNFVKLVFERHQSASVSRPQITETAVTQDSKPCQPP